MKLVKKQVKITKLFRKHVKAKATEDSAALDEEIEELEQTLRQKQVELFQLQRNNYRLKTIRPKMEPIPFVRPEKIVLTNSVETLKSELEIMSMSCGIEIQSYVDNEHCTVVYHMQHDAPHQVKHGLQIAMNNGVYDTSMTSLPVGFNLPAVLGRFKNVMLPECLLAVKKALVAYYDRLEQYDRLKDMVKMEAQLFKLLDGSHMEITFMVQNENDPEENQIQVKLILDYRIYDIRPKQYSLVESDVEGAIEALQNQCTVFKKKPLHRAFREAFIEGNGAYVMVEQFGTEPIVQERRHKRPQPTNPHHNNDDTYRPEEYSESEDDAR